MTKIERQNRILLAAELVLAAHKGPMIAIDGVLPTAYSCTALGTPGDTLREKYAKLFCPYEVPGSSWLRGYQINNPSDDFDPVEWRRLALCFFREMQ